MPHMNPVSDLLSRIFRGALKLVLVLAAMAFVLSEQSRQYTQGMWPGRTPPGDVVDVDATEVGERPGAESPLQRLR